MDADLPGPGPEPAADAAEVAVPVIVVTPVGEAVDPHPTVAAIAVGLRDERLTPVLLCPVRSGRPRVRRRVSDVAGLGGPLAINGVDEHPASRLAGGLTTIEPVRLYGSGPPVLAAQTDGQPLPPVAVQAALVSRTARQPDVDLVLLADGLGLFTPIDGDGATTADLLDLLSALQVRVGVVIVCDIAPGTLHAATAVVEALRARHCDLLGTVLATRPEPDDLLGGYVADTLESATGVPLLGSIPAGAADWDVAQFTDRAGAWLPVR